MIRIFSGGCGSTIVHFTELIWEIKITSCHISLVFVCNPTVCVSLRVFISRSSFILYLHTGYTGYSVCLIHIQYKASDKPGYAWLWLYRPPYFKVTLCGSCRFVRFGAPYSFRVQGQSLKHKSQARGSLRVEIWSHIVQRQVTETPFTLFQVTAPSTRFLKLSF